VAVAQLVRALDCGSRGFAGSIPVSHPTSSLSRSKLERAKKCPAKFSFVKTSENVVGQIYMYYVYILQSLKDESYYTGFTTDVEARLKKHNSGAVEYTSTKRPFKLVWYCCFEDKVKALQFEKYLKSGSGFALARKRLV
jgi:putative endonuclease